MHFHLIVVVFLAVLVHTFSRVFVQCPSNSWLCPSCDVWNKPRLSVCNFCQFDATYSDNLEVYLSDEEQDGYDEDEERSDLLADEDRLAAQYDIKDLL